MKKLICILVTAWLGHAASAQFIKAELQVAGLTCSMCSRAVDKQLRTLYFIDSVGIDLEKTSFMLFFKKDGDVDLRMIKKKVEDAGFSVALLSPVYSFKDHPAQGIDSFTDHGRMYYVRNSNKALSGEVQFKVIDKGFVSAKESKKYPPNKEGEGINLKIVDK